MMDDEIIELLRTSARESTAVAVAAVLDQIVPGGLTQGSMIAYFKRAFPEIPMRTLLDAGGWHRVSAGGLSDADFDALLRPWLPSAQK